MENPFPQTPQSIENRSWAERNGFAEWGLAVIWLILAFIGFQVVAAIVAVVLMLANAPAGIAAGDAMQMMTENLDLVFIGNSAGQILFLGIATWFFSRLHIDRTETTHLEYLRFQTPTNIVPMTAVTAVLIVAIQPAVWFLAWINAQVPVPEFFSNMQNTQMEMIKQYLTGDHLLLLTLFHVGVVPAVCEEILYRGYVFRAFQRSWGPVLAIVMSGLIFGAYHMQLTNLLPLAAIGMVLAYVTWTTESIYPAIIAHFINNGGSVLVGTYYPESAFAELTPETMPSLWAFALSVLVSAYLIYWMYNRHQTIKKSEEGGGTHVQRPQS